MEHAIFESVLQMLKRIFRWRAALVLMMVSMLAVPSLAQDGAVTEQRRIEHFVIPQGQSEVRISDRDKISPQVMDLIRRADCRLDDDSPEFSIHVFTPTALRQMVALVPCRGISPRSIALTFLRPDNDPRLMTFPVISPPYGVGLTHMPGFLQWDAGSKTLTATERSDMCPSFAKRYTYRYQRLALREEASLSWVLLKAEIAKDTCGNSTPHAWTTYWEAPRFFDLPKPE